MKRLFIAIPISEEIKSACENFINLNPPMKCKWVSRENQHITLVFLGNFPKNYIDKLSLFLLDFFLNQPSFFLKFESFCFAPSDSDKKMIWGKFHKSHCFDLLIKQTYDKLYHFYNHYNIDFHIKIRKINSPHITLCRIKNDIKFNQLNFSSSPDFLHVNKCILFESSLMPTAAKYTSIKVFDLLD